MEVKTPGSITNIGIVDAGLKDLIYIIHVFLIYVLKLNHASKDSLGLGIGLG